MSKITHRDVPFSQRYVYSDDSELEEVSGTTMHDRSSKLNTQPDIKLPTHRPSIKDTPSSMAPSSSAVREKLQATGRSTSSYFSGRQSQSSQPVSGSAFVPSRLNVPTDNGSDERPNPPRRSQSYAAPGNDYSGLGVVPNRDEANGSKMSGLFGFFRKRSESNAPKPRGASSSYLDAPVDSYLSQSQDLSSNVGARNQVVSEDELASSSYFQNSEQIAITVASPPASVHALSPNATPPHSPKPGQDLSLPFGNDNMSRSGSVTYRGKPSYCCGICGAYTYCQSCETPVVEEDVYAYIESAKDCLSEDETPAFYSDDRALARVHVGQSTCGTMSRLERQGLLPSDAKALALIFTKYKYNSTALQAIGEEAMQRIGSVSSVPNHLALANFISSGPGDASQLAGSLPLQHFPEMTSNYMSMKDTTVGETVESSYWTDFTSAIPLASTEPTSQAQATRPSSTSLPTRLVDDAINRKIQDVHASVFAAGFSSPVLGPYTPSLAASVSAAAPVSPLMSSVSDINVGIPHFSLDSTAVAVVSAAMSEPAPLVSAIPVATRSRSGSAVSQSAISTVSTTPRQIQQSVSPPQPPSQPQSPVVPQNFKFTQSVSPVRRFADGTEASLAGLSPLVSSKRPVEISFAPISLLPSQSESSPTQSAPVADVSGIIGTTGTVASSSISSSSQPPPARRHIAHLSNNGSAAWIRTDALSVLTEGSDFLQVGFNGYKSTSVSISKDHCYLVWDCGNQVETKRRKAAPLPTTNPPVGARRGNLVPIRRVTSTMPTSSSTVLPTMESTMASLASQIQAREVEFVPSSEICDVENARSRRIYEAMYNVVRSPVESEIFTNSLNSGCPPKELVDGNSHKRYIPIEAITAVVARPSCIRIRCLPASALPLAYSLSIYYEFPERVPLRFQQSPYSGVDQSATVTAANTSSPSNPAVPTLQTPTVGVRMIRKSLDLVSIDGNIFALWVKGLSLLRNCFENLSPIIVSNLGSLPLWVTLERKWPSILQIKDLDSRTSIEKTFERLEMLERAKAQELAMEEAIDLARTQAMERASLSNETSPAVVVSPDGCRNTGNAEEEDENCPSLANFLAETTETTQVIIESTPSIPIYETASIHNDSVFAPPMTLRPINRAIRLQPAAEQPVLVSMNDLMSLLSQLPKPLQLASWRKVYHMSKMGSGFDQLNSKLAGLQNRQKGCLLMLKDNNNSVIGCFTSDLWFFNKGYYGSAPVFVFSADDATQGSNPFAVSSMSPSTSTSTLSSSPTSASSSPSIQLYQHQGVASYYQFSDSQGFGLGGGGGVALFVDYDLRKGRSEWSQTFMNPPLHRSRPKTGGLGGSLVSANVTSDNTDEKSQRNQFLIYDVEVWIGL